MFASSVRTRGEAAAVALRVLQESQDPDHQGPDSGDDEGLGAAGEWQVAQDQREREHSRDAEDGEASKESPNESAVMQTVIVRMT